MVFICDGKSRTGWIFQVRPRAQTWRWPKRGWTLAENGPTRPAWGRLAGTPARGLAGLTWPGGVRQGGAWFDWSLAGTLKVWPLRLHYVGQGGEGAYAGGLVCKTQGMLHTSISMWRGFFKTSCPGIWREMLVFGLYIRVGLQG